MVTTARPPDLELLRAFVAVARRRSFTAAARELGVDKSKLSRQLRALEAHLGVALLSRTTRAVTATAEGASLLGRIEPHLDGLVVALGDGGARERAGTVTLTAPADLARALLGPVLATFRVRHPAITLELRVESELTDLVRAGVDLALRVGRPGAGSLVARRLRTLSAGFFASPDYLRRRGVPRAPAELAHHERLWPGAVPGRVSFASDRRASPSVACSDFGVLGAIARAGGGIALLPLHAAEDDLKAGRLVRVLPAAVFRDAPLYLVSRPERPVPPRVAALRQHLLDALKG